MTPLSRSGVIMGARDRRLSGLPVYLKEESEEKGAVEACEQLIAPSLPEESF